MSTQTDSQSVADPELQSFQEVDHFAVPPPDIVAYNELRSCADLFRMYQEGILEIAPDFQREVVWNDAAQTRFIDSLMKQLPIPSMCFSLDYKTQKWQVIDGLQRISSIVRFLQGQGSEWRLSRLDDIDARLAGESVATFFEDSDYVGYLRRLQNAVLPVTVLRCDYSKSDHMDYLFTIFHRLNSGGARLNNQEIRNCIYSGPLNDFLREMDQNPPWLSLTGRTGPHGDRYRGQEQILRFLAFHTKFEEYRGGLAKFLNDFMHRHRLADRESIDRWESVFLRTVELVNGHIFNRHADDKPGVSVLEATMVGVSLNLDKLERSPASDLREKYHGLLASEEFSEAMLREGLAARARVLGRMRTAARVFGESNDGQQN